MSNSESCSDGVRRVLRSLDTSYRHDRPPQRSIVVTARGLPSPPQAGDAAVRSRVPARQRSPHCGRGPTSPGFRRWRTVGSQRRPARRGCDPQGRCDRARPGAVEGRRRPRPHDPPTARPVRTSNRLGPAAHEMWDAGTASRCRLPLAALLARLHGRALSQMRCRIERPSADVRRRQGPVDQERVAGSHLAQHVSGRERDLGRRVLVRAAVEPLGRRARPGVDLGLAEDPIDVAERRRIGQPGVHDLGEVVGEDRVGLRAVGGV